MQLNKIDPEFCKIKPKAYNQETSNSQWIQALNRIYTLTLISEIRKQENEIEEHESKLTLTTKLNETKPKTKLNLIYS